MLWHRNKQKTLQLAFNARFSCNPDCLRGVLTQTKVMRTEREFHRDTDRKYQIFRSYMSALPSGKAHVTGEECS